MSEIAKTVTFVALAAVVALVAFFTRPSPPVTTPEGMVGKELFPDFTDPLAATSLEIFKYDEDTASVLPFKVAQVSGRWSIPSHDDYPADAKDHLADAAAGMMGLKVLEVASDSPGDHELYGVVDPDPEKLGAGATGVGIRVTMKEMKEKSEKTLLSLIIGKEVPDRDGLRYVRRTGEDPVYAVALKTSKLSAKFADWIEEDLLKLSSWDIRNVEIRDYSIDELQGTVGMRSRLTLDYNDTGDPKWKLSHDLIFDIGSQKWVPNPNPITEGEELDNTKLDDMRRALDDLKIVDVARKPAGLSRDLRNLEGAETFLNNREAVASLRQCGFYPLRWEDTLELLSTKGEIHSVTKEGVKYILRFGNIDTSGANSGGEKQEGEGEEENADSEGGVNRFLFVMAELDESVIEKPKLEPLPEKPAEAKEAENKDAEEKKDEASDAADSETADAKEEADAADEKSEEQKQYEAEVERIEKENKRKQDEYDEKVKKGREKVKELSDRFADWYYVISDDVYSKIHLTREDIVKEKEKEESEEASETAPAEPADPAAMLREPLEEPGTEPAEDATEEMSPETQSPPADAMPAEEKAVEEAPATEEKPADPVKPSDEKPAAKEASADN